MKKRFTWTIIVLSLIGASMFILNKPYFANFKGNSTKHNATENKKNVIYNEHKNDFKNLNKEDLNSHYEEVNPLLAKLAVNNTSDSNIESQLNNLGVYKVPTENNTDKDKSTHSNSIHVATPTIWYDSRRDEWVVCAGQSWKDDSWKKDKFLYGNVGGLDVIGFGFYNTSGKHDFIRVNTELYVTDHHGNSKTTVAAPVLNYDSRAGIAFAYQDRIDFAFRNKKHKVYYGEGAACIVRFSKEFKDYSGFCYGFYTHTWKNADVTSLFIPFPSKTPLINIDLTNENNSITVFSSGRTRF